MTELIGYVIAAFLLGLQAGLLVGFSIRRRRPRVQKVDGQKEVWVKHVKPSFRDPGRSFVTKYERYKTREGLFAPVRPGRGSVVEEREVEKRERGR